MGRSAQKAIHMIAAGIWPAELSSLVGKMEWEWECQIFSSVYGLLWGSWLLHSSKCLHHVCLGTENVRCEYLLSCGTFNASLCS